MKILSLSSGHQVKLDDEDFERVSRYLWHVRFSYYDLAKKAPLVVSPGKNKNGHSTNILLPRLILFNPPKDYAVKFKDGDRLNMQKCNLYMVRYCRLSIQRQKLYREQARTAKKSGK